MGAEIAETGVAVPGDGAEGGSGEASDAGGGSEVADAHLNVTYTILAMCLIRVVPVQ